MKHLSLWLLVEIILMVNTFQCRCYKSSKLFVKTEKETKKLTFLSFIIFIWGSVGRVGAGGLRTWCFPHWCSPVWCLFQLLDHISGLWFTGTWNIHITWTENQEAFPHLLFSHSLAVPFQAQQNWQPVFTFSSSVLFMQNNGVYEWVSVSGWVYWMQ